MGSAGKTLTAHIPRILQGYCTGGWRALSAKNQSVASRDGSSLWSSTLSQVVCRAAATMLLITSRMYYIVLHQTKPTEAAQGLSAVPSRCLELRSTRVETRPRPNQPHACDPTGRLWAENVPSRHGPHELYCKCSTMPPKTSKDTIQKHNSKTSRCPTNPNAQ